MNEIRNMIVILNPNSINLSYDNNSSPMCTFFIHHLLACSLYKINGKS